MAEFTGVSRRVRAMLSVLALALAALAVVILLARLGVTDPVNKGAADLLFDYGPSVGGRGGGPVLVELPIGIEERAQTDWLALVEGLQKAGVSRIVFIKLPEAAPNILQGLGSMERVMLTRSAWPVEGLANAWDVEKGAAPLSSVPLPEAGVVRRQHFEIGGVPTFEAVLAGREDKGSFGIDYSHPPEDLARIESQRIVDGTVPEGLLEGRIALVGPGTDPEAQGRPVPYGAYPRGIGDLEFHGYALTTLLENREISYLEGLPRDLVLVVAAFLIFVLAWMGRGGANRIMVVPLVLLEVLGFCAVFLWLGVLLPGVGIVLLTIAIPAGVAVLRYRERQMVLGQVVRGLSSRVHERLFSQLPQTSDERWQQIQTMVTQTLHLHRSIFLEVIPGEMRLREVASINCSLKDIAEPRRDYRRAPYSTALAHNGVIKLTKKYLLATETDQEETEFMVPLQFAGQLQGFWGLTMTGVTDKIFAERKRAINAFAEQIAERLFRNTSRIKGGAAGGAGLLASGRGSDVAVQVRRSSRLLERRQNLLESVVEGISGAVVAYDLFGHLLLINESMVELLSSAGIKPFELNALDFILAVTDLDQEAGRRFIGHAVVEGQTLSIASTMTGGGQRHMLSLSAINSGKKGDAGDGDVEQLGILFELVNVSEVDTQFRLRETVADYMNMRLRNDMAALLLGARVQKDSRISEEKRLESARTMDAVLRRMLEGMNEMQAMLDTPVEMVAKERFPVNVKSILERLLPDFRKRAEKERLVLEEDLIRLPALVISGPDALAGGVRAMLEVLFQDCTQEGKVNITMTEDAKHITLVMKNTGFGIPNDQFQRYISGEEDLKSREFRDLREFHRHVIDCDGQALWRSAPGEGFVFKTILALSMEDALF